MQFPETQKNTSHQIPTPLLTKKREYYVYSQ